MEKELKARLDKGIEEIPSPAHIPENLLTITMWTLAAIRAHIIECYPDRFGDSGMLEDAIAIVKDYQ